MDLKNFVISVTGTGKTRFYKGLNDDSFKIKNVTKMSPKCHGKEKKMDISINGYRLMGDENKIKVEVGTTEKKKWVNAQIIGFYPRFMRFRTEYGYVVALGYHEAIKKMKGVKVSNE